MRKLAIFCAGNLGKEIYDIAKRVNDASPRWEGIFFVDNHKKSDAFYGQVVHSFEECVDMIDVEYVIANGEPKHREEIYLQLMAHKCKVTSLIDPTAIVSVTAELGKGVIVTPFSTISSDVKIANNVLVNSYVRVGHDIHIKEHAVISANTSIGGDSKIGKAAFLGMGSVVKEELQIGDEAILGMGAVLYKDLPTGSTAIGNPARVTKGSDSKKVFS